MNIFYCKRIEVIRKKNANIIKTASLETLYFSSLKKLKYLPEWMNNEIKESANEIFSVHKNDLKKTIFISLIFKNININIIENIKNITNNDFIKIVKVRLIE